MAFLRCPLMNIRNLLMIVSFALSVVIGLTLAHGNSGSTASTHGRPLIGFQWTLKEQRWQGDRDLFV